MYWRKTFESKQSHITVGFDTYRFEFVCGIALFPDVGIWINIGYLLLAAWHGKHCGNSGMEGTPDKDGDFGMR